MSTATHQHYLPVREDWLATAREDALDPAQPIIDPHHHLWDRPGWRYMIDEILADLRSGHDIRATVHVQARSMYRADAPAALAPVGETEFVNGIAAMSASGQYGPTRIAAGIVGFADLRLGAAVRDVLEAHAMVSGGATGRFRGIRHTTTWDPDPVTLNPANAAPEGLMGSAAFREGFAQLGALGLSYDAWLHFHQIPQLTSLARAFPDTKIVLNHCGGVLGIGRYTRETTFPVWSAAVRDLATCPNVMVKLGGLGMRLPGFGFETRDRAPFSTELAEAWKPWMTTLIEIFGTGRCMFESNFPVDKGGFGYAAGWNAMKRLASGASSAEKADLFWRSAARFYRLPDIA